MALQSPDAPGLHTQLGFLLAQKRDVKGAIGEFEKALSRNRTDVRAMGGLASSYIAMNQSAAGEKVFEKIVAADPKFGPSVLNLVNLRIASKKMPQAEKDLQAYLAQKPKDDGALSALARIKFANADYAAAESIIRQAIQVAPDRVEYRDALGMTLEAQNKVNEAIAEYREALRRQANDPVAGNNLAWLLVENGGNLEEALKLAQMAKERSPENPAISDTLGWIYLKKNVPGTAISEFKNALQREPNNPMFNYHLGLAYKQTGDNNLAAKYIQLALDSKQPFPAQEKAQALLRSLK